MDGSRECKVCGIGTEETVYHLFVECAGYVCERGVLMRHVNESMGEIS